MAFCKRCGKRLLLPTIIAGDYCSKCQNEIEAEKKNLEQEKQAAKQEQLDYAAHCLSELVSTYKKSHISITDSSIEDLKEAKNNCARCIELIQELPNVPEIDSVLINSVSVLSRRLPSYELQGIGRVDLDFHKNQIILDRPYHELQNLCKTYDSLIENSVRFESYMKSLHSVHITPTNFTQPFESSTLNLPTLKTRNITARTPISSLNNFIVLDTETTGLSPAHNEIIQISAIRFLNFIPVENFSTYIKPRKGLNPEAARVNNITDDLVADAPYFEQIQNALLEYLDTDTPLVGHNISFDLNFLFSSGIPFSAMASRRIYDTLDLSKREFSDMNSYSLKYLCRHVLKISRSNSHDSLSDALATGLLFEKICRQRMHF